MRARRHSRTAAAHARPQSAHSHAARGQRVEAGGERFTASGKELIDPGFTAILESSAIADTLLPELAPAKRQGTVNSAMTTLNDSIGDDGPPFDAHARGRVRLPEQFPRSVRGEGLAPRARPGRHGSSSWRPGRARAATLTLRLRRAADPHV